MGDRGNIRIDYADGGQIYFYGHWHGSVMFNILQSALERGRSRWDDEPYLARIIFSELIQTDVTGLTGFGIAPYICDNEYPILGVDCKKQTVCMWQERAIDSKGSYDQEWTFDEFIALTKDPRRPEDE